MPRGVFPMSSDLEVLRGAAMTSSQMESNSTESRPQPQPGLTPVLERNIRSLDLRRAREEARASLEERIAQAITDFSGSMKFVYLHVAIFGCWIVGNLGIVPGLSPWDPSFVVLAMVASVEAIFLSTFVLITQNRMAAIADKRADLDLQISLLSEHEITRLITLVRAMADRMGIEASHDPELSELSKDVQPEKVLDRIEENARR